MAWNQPTNKDAKPTSRAAPRARGLLIASIIICGGLTATLLYLRGGSQNLDKRREVKRTSAILDVGTNITTKAAVAETNVVDRTSIEWLKANDPRYQIPPGSYRKANGRLYTPEGRRILERPATRIIHMDKGKKVFRHPAENQIARLLSIEPGKMFLGNIHYGPQFVESFRKSITEPTLITQEDDAETRALKEHVNEVKADLRERMDKGEDICAIMKETEDELRSLSTLNLNLRKEVREAMLDENVSAEDYELYVEAANKMLEERGMKKITAPKIVESQLKYMRERNKARIEAKAKADAEKAASQKQ